MTKFCNHSDIVSSLLRKILFTANDFFESSVWNLDDCLEEQQVSFGFYLTFDGSFVLLMLLQGLVTASKAPPLQSHSGLVEIPAKHLMAEAVALLEGLEPADPAIFLTYGLELAKSLHS